MPEGWRGTVREIDEKPRMGRQVCEGNQPRPGKSRLTALRHHDVGGPLVQGGMTAMDRLLAPLCCVPHVSWLLRLHAFAVSTRMGCGDGKKSLVARTRTV